MSGSYDRPTGPPTLQPTQRAGARPLRRSALDRPPLRTAAAAHDQPRTARPGGGTSARTRGRRNEPAPTNAPIVPAGSVTGRSLTLVITIMCFLACLTAGAVYMMNQSASAWLRDIASEVTVQIEAKERTDLDKVVADVTRLPDRSSRASPAARALSVADSAQLLEPWLGQTDALSALPVPRLDRRRARSQPRRPTSTRCARRLEREFKGVTLDDHRRWQQQIRTITRSFALGGLAILLLVGAATTAIIVSATRSAMASNRDIVEVLHFVGATDRFIAREFERHFLRLGVRAGIVGAIWAMFVFLVMPTVMELLGGGAVTIAEIRG